MSGESNFTMDYTGLTVGGFTQPSVARGLIEYPPNVEKGLCQRFLWLLPKPNPTLFSELERVDETFSASIGEFVMLCLRYCVLFYTHAMQLD